MTEKVNCPFCGNLVNVDAIRCEVCDALFQEPKLPNFKFNELGSFIAIYILTFGIFSTLWFLINSKTIKKFIDNKIDKKKFNWLIFIMSILFIISTTTGLIIAGILPVEPENIFFIREFTSQVLALFALNEITYILLLITIIALTYRTLRCIQKYTLKTYNSKIEINPVYIIIFNIFYLIHYIDTYQNRVLQHHVFFEWKSAKGILLMIILGLLAILMPTIGIYSMITFSF